MAAELHETASAAFVLRNYDDEEILERIDKGRWRRPYR